MWQHIGASRWIYNYMLSEQMKRYENGEKHLSAFDMNRLITVIKKQDECSWLYEVSNATLCRTCADLNEAYQSFFKKRTGFPKFKSRKRSKPSFPLRDSIGGVWFEEAVAHLPKLGKVKYKTDFDIPYGREAKFSNPRIAFVNNKWILSFGTECENQVYELNDYSVGIDLGVKDSAVIAYGDKKIIFPNINKSRKVRQIKKQVRHLQRSISRKYEANRRGSRYIKTKNIEREEDKLRKLHARLSNIRENCIHQATHTIVSLLPKRVVMEDLNVAGMMKNKHLSKAIQEQCFFEWTRQISYKCEWRGIEFVQVDRFYPSSKTCHNCGCIKNNLKLKDRVFVCEECGYTEDRDYNAALNLMSYGN